MQINFEKIIVEANIAHSQTMNFLIDSPLLSFRWHIYVLQTLCWKSLSGEFVSSHKHCHFLLQYVFSRWFNSFLLSLLLISMSGFCKASFAALSAISFPEMSQWPGIHSKLTLIPFKYKLLHKINISSKLTLYWVFMLCKHQILNIDILRNF